jgi:hypothetical protein
MGNDERDLGHFPTSSGRESLYEERSMVLAKPVSKELARDAYLGSRFLDPLEVNRDEPRFIDLFGHLPLDIGQGILPHA